MTESKGHTYIKEHPLSGEALLFDLEEQASSVLSEAKGGTAGRAARTLVKEGPLRMTIVGFEAGGSLADHKAGGPVSIAVLSGSVQIMIGERSEQLSQGQTLVVGADVTHSLAAPADAVILLTIAMPR
jgi:quercetin dioxygenase-like cupin family protein